jgi:hypothetical protein
MFARRRPPRRPSIPQAPERSAGRATRHPHHHEWRNARIAMSRAAHDASDDGVGPRATRGDANHCALIRALSIADASSRALSRASCEKNFRLRRIILTRAATHRSRAAKVAARDSRDCIGRTSQVKKTLAPCGFLHC